MMLGTKEIIADTQAGQLDHLWQLALEDIKAERTKSLDEILNES
ncbi:MAG TPA: hypothetical protein VGN90_13085 [Pyrinomonadaceae bacterium]|jgi:hypothetical protein|nr:hypothetical protein [Pyrinomonadaceae bacterium]